MGSWQYSSGDTDLRKNPAAFIFVPDGIFLHFLEVEVVRILKKDLGKHAKYAKKFDMLQVVYLSYGGLHLLKNLGE